MATKHIVDLKCLDEIFNELCDFAENKTTPNDYCKNDQPEEALQIHLSRHLSNSHDVLREVSIPALAELEGSGKKIWEIDESLRIEDINKQNHYASGELKFHGKGMSDRDFVGDAINDINRMALVAEYYFDITMAFTLFITCDKEERDAVHKCAEKLDKVRTIRNINVPEKDYYAVAVLLIPSARENSHDPMYGVHWRERYDYLVSQNQLKDYYFPQRVRIFH